MQQTQAPIYQVILSSNIIPGYLKNADTSAIPQFLLGYRNILYHNGNNICWGLTKNKKFCAKSFSYVITKEQTYALQHYKGENQQLEIVGYNYLILQKQESLKLPHERLDIQVIQKLLNQLGGVNKVNLSILKNNFDTYQQYLSVIGENIEKILKIQDEAPANLESIQKKIYGKQLLQIPLIDKENGNWSYQKTMTLKFVDHQ